MLTENLFYMGQAQGNPGGLGEVSPRARIRNSPPSGFPLPGNDLVFVLAGVSSPPAPLLGG